MWQYWIPIIMTMEMKPLAVTRSKENLLLCDFLSLRLVRIYSWTVDWWEWLFQTHLYILNPFENTLGTCIASEARQICSRYMKYYRVLGLLTLTNSSHTHTIDAQWTRGRVELRTIKGYCAMCSDIALTCVGPVRLEKGHGETPQLTIPVIPAHLPVLWW